MQNFLRLQLQVANVCMNFMFYSEIEILVFDDKKNIAMI